MDFLKGAGAILLTLLLIVVLAIGGWKLGWWMERESTNKRTSIANDSLARQQALLDQSIDGAADIARIDAQLQNVDGEQAKALRGQRIAIVTRFCASASQIRDTMTIPASVSVTYSEEC